MIKLLRIDDRLLHGEVAFSWIEYYNLKRIIIVNDEASQNDFTRMILELSKPKNVELTILQLEFCNKEIINEAFNEENCIVIVGNCFDAQIVNNIFIENDLYKININIGGLRNRPNSVQLMDAVYLSKEDIKILRNFINQDIRVYVKRMPDDKEINITSKILENINGQ